MADTEYIFDTTTTTATTISANNNNNNNNDNNNVVFRVSFNTNSSKAQWALNGGLRF